MFKNLDFSYLFNLNNIFDLSPGNFNFYNEFIYFFSLIFLLSLIIVFIRYFFIQDKVTKKLLKRVRKFLFSLSFWSFLWLFFRWQNVYVFSARFLFYIILLVYLVRAILLARYYFLNYKEDLDEYNKKQIIKKYMPKRNKNRKKNK
jgi:hypothetical protein